MIAQYYNGSAWVDCQVFYYNGAEWVNCTIDQITEEDAINAMLYRQATAAFARFSG